MFQANQAADAISAGPSFRNKRNIQQSKQIKVMFPFFPHQFSMLKRYLSTQSLTLNDRNRVSCGLRNIYWRSSKVNLGRLIIFLLLHLFFVEMHKN